MHLPDMLWTTSWIRSKTLIINTPTKNSGDTGFRWCHEIPTKTHLPITPQRRSIKGELGNTKAEIQSLDPKLVSTFLCPYLHHVFTSLQLLLKSAATSIDHQVSSKGCTEQQTELCPNRIRTSKHQTMCHHLSDLWRYGCRFKRFCLCLACQLPCFCSWLIFESMEAHCCFGVCKYRCPSEIVRNSLCLRSFRPLLNLLYLLCPSARPSWEIESAHRMDLQTLHKRVSRPYVKCGLHRDETNMSKPIETWWHDMILVMYEHWWYIEIHVQFSYIHVRYVTLKYIKYNRSMFTYVRMYDSSVLYYDCPTVFVPCFSTTSLCKWEFADGHIPRLAVIHRQRLDVHKNAPMLNIKPWNRQKNLPQRSVACILS